MLKILEHEVIGGTPVAGPLMREAAMKSADAGDEKLGPDALRGGELADDDLEGLAGGCAPVPEPTAAKKDAPPPEII